jgi:hypothetical protein
MSQENIFLFTIFCGVLGILLRRNFLNVTVSILQSVIGINALLSSFASEENTQSFALYLMIFLLLVVLIFLHSIAILLIKRRSTLHVNELTELRG